MLQRCALRSVGLGQRLGDQPWLRGIKSLIDLISVRHDFADGTTEFTRLDIGLYRICCVLPVGTELGCIARIGEFAIKIFADEDCSFLF